MKPPHPLLKCHAHNRFSPSIALWQHFVGLDWPCSTQHRLVATAAAPVQDDADRPVNEQVGNGPQRVNITRKKTDKGTWFATKAEASIAHNKVRQITMRQARAKAPETLLASTKQAFAAHQDYTGVVVEPMEDPTPIAERFLPWCVAEKDRTMAGMDRLAVEIDKFYEYARPSSWETKARRHLTTQVRDHVRKILPKHELEVFGSERTGLALPTSDIDFRLVSPTQRRDESARSNFPPSSNERHRGKTDLYRLLNARMGHDKAYLLVHLRHARYPLLMLQDRNSRLDVQIVLSNDTSLSREYIKQYMQQYPYLRKLFFVVKTMFDVRGLSDVFRGGFGSYTLFMMIVASIRHNPHPRGDAAGALMNFLKFYRNFNTSKEGLSIEPVSKFNKHKMPVLTKQVETKIKNKESQPLPPYMLCLRDPADKTNDLGRKAIAIKHVQATFKHLCARLDYDLPVNTRPSLLSPLVGTSYMLNKQRRYDLESYGRQVSEQHSKLLALQAKMVREQESVGQVEKSDVVNMSPCIGKSNDDPEPTAETQIQSLRLQTGETNAGTDADQMERCSTDEALSVAEKGSIDLMSEDKENITKAS
ncbi:hypothetical protein BDU57DRAFT_516011 [Ampelomyces quisqualis]|uniref:polynucleotide adenylyltransferase n=1 Tax=Ampelomyces quisqualis TaxID=50730 RepID=A0A6A5QL15_AMPQU|nr:hypothetical protein BDU57DRAFT_516011 [Ampelomyces quisqualis]